MSRRHSRRAAAVVLLLPFVAVACEGRNRTGGFSIDELRVVSVEPADGAAGVAPDAQVLLGFSQPVRELPAGALVVDDGGGPVPGSAEPLVDGVFWRWTPATGLPRGARVEVRVPAGLTSERGAVLAPGFASSFTVREAAAVAAYDLPGAARGALAWPNGRRVALVDQRVFELTATGPVERFVALQPDARPWGDGGFVDVASAAGSGPGGPKVLVRGDLAGARDEVAMPPGAVLVSDVDPRGDVVVATAAAPWRFWRLLADAVQFEELVPASTWLGLCPCAVLDQDGASSIGFVDGATGRLAVARYPAGSVVPQVFDLPVRTPATSFTFGVGDDGRGLMVWLDGSGEVFGARFDPAAGLAQVRLGARSPDLVATTLAFGRVAGSGSAVVTFDVYPTASNPAFRTLALRVEPDGKAGEVETWLRHASPSPSQPSPKSGFSPRRGELVLGQVVPDGTGLTLLRSRPGEALDQPRAVYAVSQPGRTVHRFAFAHDDLGRAVLVVTEAVGGSPVGTRAVVLE